MLDIFILLLPLFALIGIGYLVGRTHIADTSWVTVLNLFGYYVAFPALIFQSISATTISFSTHGTSMLAQAAFGIALMAFTYWITGLLHLTTPLRNTFTIGVYFANTGYIGIPALQLVFGNEAAAQGAVIVAIMILVTFTLGVGLLEKSRSRKINIKDIILSIIKNPLIWAALLGVLASISDVTQPAVLSKLIAFMAGAASPAVLVALGVFLALNHPKRSTLRYALTLSGIKMLGIPAMFSIVLWLTSDSVLNTGQYSMQWLDVMYIQAAMPVAVTAFAFAEIYPMDKEVISTSIVISTLSCMFILPCIMWLSMVL